VVVLRKRAWEWTCNENVSFQDRSPVKKSRAALGGTARVFHSRSNDAHRGDGERFVVHADEKATAFLELERAICIQLLSEQC
jgi:hypothetical protein